jgi:hypothetical protein
VKSEKAGVTATTFSLFHFLTFNLWRLPAVAAATVSAASAAATSASATSAAIVLAGASFVNDHIAAVILLAVKLRDRRVRSVFVSHLDKAKAARTARLTIVNDIGRLDSSGGRKMFLQILTCHSKGQVSNVKFITHFPLYFLFSREAKRRAKSDVPERDPIQQRRVPNQKFQKLPLSKKPTLQPNRIASLP